MRERGRVDRKAHKRPCERQRERQGENETGRKEINIDAVTDRVRGVKPG